MKIALPVSLAVTLLVSIGCERKTVVIEVPSATPIEEPVAKTKTLETARLDEALDRFERGASAENGAEVKKAFAKLDGEIAELEEYIAKHTGDQRVEAAAKLKNLQGYRTAESARFTAAQVKAPKSESLNRDARSGAEKAGNSAGEAIEDSAKRAGDAIRDVVR